MSRMCSENASPPAGAFKKDQLWQVCGRSEVQRRPADLHNFNSGQGTKFTEHQAIN